MRTCRRLAPLPALLLAGCVTVTQQNASRTDAAALSAAPLPGRPPPPPAAAAPPLQYLPLVHATAQAGQPHQIAFLTALAPDCTPLGVARGRVTLPPSHGTVELRATEGFNHAPPGNPRAACNGRPVPGLSLGYLSAAAYRGTDDFVVQLAFPDGATASLPVQVTVQ